MTTFITDSGAGPHDATPQSPPLKVRGAANPYDPIYSEYFAQRRCFAWRVL
jgi:hypothetical protein